MSHYVISISPDEVGHEYRVLLRGPGIDSDGHRYIFATTHRCAVFAEAVNFAYEQGLRDGMRRTRNEQGRLLLVTGASPENLDIRTEGWWSRLKRGCLTLL